MHCRKAVVCTRHTKSKRCRKILLVADHDIDIPGNVAVHTLGLCEAANALPKTWAVVQVVGNNRAVPLGRLYSFDREGSRGFRQGRKNAAGVKPSHANRAKEMIPVNVARLQLARGSVASVGHAHSTAHPEPSLCEIESIANRPSDAVVGSPHQKVCVHASLHDKVFDEMADLVIDKGRHHSRLEAKALPEATGNVVFAPSFPHLKMSGRADAALAGIEAKHHLAERHLIKPTAQLWLY